MNKWSVKYKRTHHFTFTDSLCLLWGSDGKSVFWVVLDMHLWVEAPQKTSDWFRLWHSGLNGDWAGSIQLLDWAQWITVDPLQVSFCDGLMWFIKATSERWIIIYTCTSSTTADLRCWTRCYVNRRELQKISHFLSSASRSQILIYRLKKIFIFTQMKTDMWELSSAARTLHCLLLDLLWVLLLARRHLGSST